MAAETTFEDRMQRTAALIGTADMARVRQASVMVIGCGAVGGYALEMVARLGFGTIWAVDFDRFEASNINRQILATVATLGQKKCEAARERALAINPDADVRAVDRRIEADKLDFILEETDTLSAKGINTIYLPAKESSEVNRGPLVDIGSLAICTNTSCPALRTSLILPFFSISGRMVVLLRGCAFLGSLISRFRNFCWLLKLGPKSW